MLGSRSRLSSTVLEEGAVQEGSQLQPIVLQDGREAWGTEGRGPPCRPPRLAAPGPHTSPRGRSHSVPAQRPGLGHCRLRQGRRGRETRSAAHPLPPPPEGHLRPRPTWEQVVGELPMQPVLQHQEQSELRRRRQESVVGSGSAPSLFSRTRCLCRRQPPPTPSSRASAPGPRSSPGYTASGSPAGKMQAKVTQRLDLNLWQQG